MATIILGTLNINGCRNAKKRAALLEYIRLKQSSVVFLQECHSDQDNQPQWEMEWKGPVFFSHCSSVSAGVATLLSPGLPWQGLSHVSIIAGRLHRVDASLDGMFFSFFNIYAPCLGQERCVFFKALSDALKSCPPDNVLILSGDFNSTLDHTLDRNHDEPHPQSANELRALIAYHGLVDVWREEFPGSRQYTWLKTNRNMLSGARLDRIYVRKQDRGRFFKTSITPMGLSDHHYVTVSIVTTLYRPKSPYWRFNSRLLQDQGFVSSFTFFWETWRVEKARCKSLTQWWDLGKVQIRLFCQQYTANSTRAVKIKLEALEQEILFITAKASGRDMAGFETYLNQNKLQLRSLLEDRGEGALVRARYLLYADMDGPTKFFFGLEKRTSKTENMQCLKLPGGRETTDSADIRSLALDFYEDLFRAEDCDVSAVDELLQGLPRLGDEEALSLEHPLSYSELTQAVQQQNSGRSPGLDGLSGEFYKAFWSLLGPDLHTVLQESVEQGNLPLSCRRAVLSLLPKKGIWDT